MLELVTPAPLMTPRVLLFHSAEEDDCHSSDFSKSLLCTFHHLSLKASRAIKQGTSPQTSDLRKNLFGGQRGRKRPRPTSHSHLKWLNLVSKLKYWIPKGPAGLSPPLLWQPYTAGPAHHHSSTARRLILRFSPSTACSLLAEILCGWA